MGPLLIVLAIAVGVASQATDNEVDYPDFLPGREYIYKYDTQVVSGMDPMSTFHSGFRMTARLHIQVSKTFQFKAELRKIMLYRLNQPVLRDQADSNLIPEQFLPEFVGPEADDMVKILQLPFQFQYKEGHVSDVVLDVLDKSWSIDMKQGLMSLFELNLQKRMLLDQMDFKGSFSVNDPEPEKDPDNYKVMESSMTGDCATLYSVKPKLTGKHLYVSKVRDFDACLEKPSFFTSVFDGYMVPNSQKDNPLTMGATLQFSLKGDKERFLILSAISETKITFSPIVGEGEIKSIVNQTLSLEAVKKPSNIIQDVKGRKISDTQRMISIPTLGDDPFRSQDQTQDNNNVVDRYPTEAIYVELVKATENTKSLTSPEALVHLRVVVSMLRSSSMDDMRELWNVVYSMDDPNGLEAKTLWNTLPHVGTEAAASFVLSVCAENEAMNINCTSSIYVITLKSKPTEKIVMKLVDVISSRSSSPQPDKLRQVAYLSLASLTYKMRLAKENHLKAIEKAQSLLKSIKNDNSGNSRRFVAQKLREASERRKMIIERHDQISKEFMKNVKPLLERDVTDEVILGLKVLGNSGDPGAIRMLHDIVTNRDAPLFARVLATVAYRRQYIDKTARKQAISTLLELYQNRRETHDLRTVAFVILINLWPEKPILESIGRSLQYEPDAMVSSFVLKYMDGLANSGYTALSQLSKNSSDALKFAPPDDGKDYYHSFTESVGKMYPHYRAGTNLRMISIGDMNRYEGWTLTLQSYLYGLHSNFMEVGVNTQDALDIVEKLINSKFSANFDSKKQNRNLDVDPQELINRIFDSLNVSTPSNGASYSHIYYKMMGHELGYIDVKQLIDSIGKKGPTAFLFDPKLRKWSMNIQYEDLIMLHDTQLTLPSEAGLPISLKLQLSGNVKVDGSIYTTEVPYPPRNRKEKQRQGDRDNEMALQFGADLHPRFGLSLHGSMGLDSFYIKPTMSFRGTIKSIMPIKGKVTVTLLSQRIKIDNYLPEMTDPIVEVHLEPISETQVLTKSALTPNMRVDRLPILAPINTKIMPVKLFYNVNFLGYKIGVDGQIPDSWYLRSPVRPLHGRTLLNFWLLPLDQAPEVISIELFTQQIQPNKTWAQAQGKADGSDLRDLAVDKDSEAHANIIYHMEKVHEGYLNLRYNMLGIVLTVNASSNQATRMSHGSLFTGRNDQSRTRVYAFHLGRTPIIGYDKNPWELTANFEVTKPDTTYKVKDIVSVSWQKQLMEQLQVQVSMDAHRVVNEVMNRTLLSILEQLDHNAMTRIPAFRVLAALQPQVLYKLVADTADSNIVGMPSLVMWSKYWKAFLDLSNTVEQEDKLVLDPAFIDRSAILISYLVDLEDGQRELLKDLRIIIQTKSIGHIELPVMQFIVFAQTRIVYMLDEVIRRDRVIGAVYNEKEVNTRLRRSKHLLDKIIKASYQIIANIDTVGDRDLEVEESVAKEETSSENWGWFSTNLFNWFDNPIQQEPKPNMEPKISNKEGGSNSEETQLINSLHGLAVFQMQVIEELQLAISKSGKVWPELVFSLIHSTRENMTLFDTQWTLQPLTQDVIMEEMLLITTQNEMLVELLHRYHDLAWQEPQDEKARTNQQLSEMFKSYLIKCESYYLGQRTASLYKYFMLNQVVTPMLTSEEVEIYRHIQQIYRTIAVKMRNFELGFTYNNTAMQDLKIADVIFKDLTLFVNDYTSKISKLQQDMLKLQGIPKVYIVTEMLETINLLRSLVELGKTSILPLTYGNRFEWMEKEGVAVQTLISSMSTIYEQFSNPTSQLREDEFVTDHLDEAPGRNWHVDIRRLQNKQKSLRSFMKNNANQVNEKIVLNILADTQKLQEFLDRNKLLIFTDMMKVDSKEVSLVTQIIRTQQEICKSLLSKASDAGLSDNTKFKVADEVDKIMGRLANMESELQSIFPDFKAAGHEEEKTSLPSLSDGINGSINITWGHDSDMRQIRIKMRLARSLEQAFWIFKQMDAEVRSEDVIHALNRDLADLPVKDVKAEIAGLAFTGDEDESMDVLNAYNHLHFSASYNESDLPEWVRAYSSRFHDYMKMTMWPHYTWQGVEKQVGEQEQVIVDISDLNKQVDMFLIREAETNKFLSVPIASWLDAVRFDKYPGSMYKQLLSKLSDEYLPAQCVLRQNRVKTFDKMYFQIHSEIDKCKLLLAMDCSKAKSFAITMVKTNQSEGGHVLEIITKDQVIELKPDKPTPQIKLNHQLIADFQDKGYRGLKRISPDLIVSRKDGQDSVLLPQTGLSVYMKGSFLKLEVATYLKDRVCGLCGNFDSQRSWDMEGPIREVYTSPISFATSYVLPEQQTRECRVDTTQHRKTQVAALRATEEFVPRYSEHEDSSTWLRTPEVTKENTPNPEKNRNWIDQTTTGNLAVERTVEVVVGRNQEKNKQNVGDLNTSDDMGVDVSEDMVDDSNPLVQNGNSDEKTEKQPLAETDIRIRRKRKQVCFSITPLLRCPEGTKVAQKRTEKITYVCLREDDNRIESLVDQASEGGIPELREMKGKRIKRRMRQELACEKQSTNGQKNRG